MSVVEAQGDSVAYTFFSLLERLVAQVFFSRTLEKLGRTCDQIGRTLEPWRCSDNYLDGLIEGANSFSASRRCLKAGELTIEVSLVTAAGL